MSERRKTIFIKINRNEKKSFWRKIPSPSAMVNSASFVCLQQNLKESSNGPPYKIISGQSCGIEPKIRPTLHASQQFL